MFLNRNGTAPLISTQREHSSVPSVRYRLGLGPSDVELLGPLILQDAAGGGEEGEGGGGGGGGGNEQQRLAVISQDLLDRFEAYLGELGFFSQPQIWATLREVVTLTQNIMKEAGEQVFLQDPQAVTGFFDRHFAHPLVVANVQHLKQFYEFCRANS